MNFRPLWIGVLLFFLANAVLTVGITASPLNAKFNFSYGNYLPVKTAMLNRQQAPDVLFLGTSQTNNGFATHIFEAESAGEVTAFNLGLPNNRYDVMRYTLQHYIHRYGKPKVLLLELSPTIQEKGGGQFYLPALYYRSLLEREPGLAVELVQDPLIAPAVKQELALASLSGFYQYRHTFSPVNLLGKVSEKVSALMAKLPLAGAAFASEEAPAASPALQQTAALPANAMERGWFPKDGTEVMQTPEGARQSAVEARRYFLDPIERMNFEKLDALLTYCREENLTVVLVSWPNHPDFVAELNRGPHGAPYRQGLHALLKKHPVPVITLQATPQEQRVLFADPRHLTAEGAQRYTAELARRVLNLSSVQQALGDVAETGAIQ